MTAKENATSLVIDWNQGHIHRSDKAQETTDNEITVTFCGDWGPLAGHETILRRDPRSFYGDVIRPLNDSDLAIFNVECPICSDAEAQLKDGPALCVEPDIFATLKGSPWNIACLANNHMMDFGEQGLESTLQSLHQMNIETLGAGTSKIEAGQPLIKEVSGFKLALINVAEGEEAKATTSKAGVASLDIPTICKQVSELANIVDAVLVIVHAGREFVPVPPPYIQTAYRAIADAGAALIVAHHPHVPQGIEIWNDVPIIYSQGNFVFINNAERAKIRNIGYLAKAKINTMGIRSIQIIPYKIKSDGLELLAGVERHAILQELGTISSYLDPSTLATIWDAYADLWSEARFSSEIRQFSLLMSWKDLCGSFSDRFKIQAQHRTGVKRFIFKVMGFGFGLVSSWLPSQSEHEVIPAAVLRNTFDTKAHRELYRTVLLRMMTGEAGKSANWARELLNSWRVLD